MNKDHLIVTLVSPETVTGQKPTGCQGASLAGVLADREKSPLLALITGESGVGKSTWCLELIHQARERGIRVSGFVAVPVVEAGQRIGIDLVDVASCERRRLAKFRPGARKKVIGDAGIATLNWVFEPSVFAWGNRILADLEACELLILDELGPLELRKKKGLTAGVQLIDAQRFQTACVVIRPALVSVALKRWPCGKILRVTNGPTLSSLTGSR